MATYQSPGVYVEEVPSGNKPIAGVGTSTAGFLGTAFAVTMANTPQSTEQAPAKYTITPGNTPVRITNWEQFKMKFGDIQAGNKDLAHAVYGFFNNGGTACWIVRIVNSGDATVDAAFDDCNQKESMYAGAAAGYDIFSGQKSKIDTYAAALIATITDVRTTYGAKDHSESIKWYLEAARDIVTDINTNNPALAEKITKINQAVFALKRLPALILSVDEKMSTLFIPIEKVRNMLDFMNITALTPATEQELTDLSTADTNLGDQRAIVNALADVNLAGFEALCNSLAELEDTASEQDATDAVTAVTDIIQMADTTTVKNLKDAIDAGLVIVDKKYLAGVKDADIFTALQLLTTTLTTIDTNKKSIVDTHKGTLDTAKAALPATITTASSVEYTSQDWEDGLSALSKIDEVAIVAAPGVLDTVIQQKVVTHCVNMQDRFAIIDGQRASTKSSGYTIEDIKKDVSDGVLGSAEKGYAAIYFPWIKVYDPVTNRKIFVPPSGHMAGIYARSDAERGVHKAPANEIVRGALGLEHELKKSEQGPLNVAGINIIRNFNGNITVWGGRTMADLSVSPEWKYIGSRRLFNYLKESIEDGTRWVVFEPNDMQLWAKIRRNLTAFLTNVWRSGALFGATPEQAFFVKCDAELNPPEVRDLGQVVVEIGVSLVKPAEFVIFRISQWQNS